MAEDDSGNKLMFIVIAILFILALTTGVFSAIKITSALSSIPSWMWWVILGVVFLSTIRGRKR